MSGPRSKVLLMVFHLLDGVYIVSTIFLIHKNLWKSTILNPQKILEEVTKVFSQHVKQWRREQNVLCSIKAPCKRADNNHFWFKQSQLPVFSCKIVLVKFLKTVYPGSFTNIITLLIIMSRGILFSCILFVLQSPNKQ